MVAIIIPTMNRSSFIRRLLSYYSHSLYESTIYIADSSDDILHIKAIKEAITDVSHNLNVVYKHYPKTNIEEAKRLILLQVSEKYASYCGDDDFLIPSTLKKCAIFLDNNQNYSNCHGTGVYFKIYDDSLFGIIQTASEYRLLANEYDDPYLRLSSYLRDYWPIWTVRRVGEFKKTLGLLKTIPLEGCREITMGCVPIIQGKTKLINDLYVLRQVHKNRFQSHRSIEAFLSERFHISYKEMHKIISNEIKNNTSKNKPETENFVHQEFVNYFSENTKATLCKKEDGLIRKLKALISVNLPFIKFFYHKYLIKQLTLPKLINKWSKHYNPDFNEVYDFLKKYNF